MITPASQILRDAIRMSRVHPQNEPGVIKAIYDLERQAEEEVKEPACPVSP